MQTDCASRRRPARRCSKSAARARRKVSQIARRAVAVVDQVGAGNRQVFLIALPAQARRVRVGRRWFGLWWAPPAPTSRRRYRRGTETVGSVTSFQLSTAGVTASCPFPRSGRYCRFQMGRAAGAGAAAVIGVHNSGRQVGRAGRVMPGGRVVAADSEIRAANDFQIVGQAGMPHGEIVGREIDFLVRDQAIQVGLVRIVDAPAGSRDSPS